MPEVFLDISEHEKPVKKKKKAPSPLHPCLTSPWDHVPTPSLRHFWDLQKKTGFGVSFLKWCIILNALRQNYFKRKSFNIDFISPRKICAQRWKLDYIKQSNKYKKKKAVNRSCFKGDQSWWRIKCKCLPPGFPLNPSPLWGERERVMMV